MAGNITLLIVDDLFTTRENIYKLLEFYPEVIPVGQAENAWEAIQKARELAPDVVLMDLNMPEMDGISGTKALLAAVPESCVLMMSVQGEREYQEQALAAGAKAYLVKPFTGQELVQTVQAVCKERSLRERVCS